MFIERRGAIRCRIVPVPAVRPMIQALILLPFASCFERIRATDTSVGSSVAVDARTHARLPGASG